MPKLEWFIGDLHIKKLKRQDTYSVRVRLTDAISGETDIT